MNTRQTIIEGDTSDVWEVGVRNPAGQLINLGAATCRMVAVGEDGAALVDRMITERNEADTRFIAWLTGGETAGMGKGTFRVAFVLIDLAQVPPLERELHEVVRIEASILPPA